MTDATCNQTISQSHGHPLFDLSSKLTRRIAALRQRRSLSTLETLDAHMLCDVGLTHDDVRRTLAQPLSVDAQTELYRIAHLNSFKHM